MKKFLALVLVLFTASCVSFGGVPSSSDLSGVMSASPSSSAAHAGSLPIIKWAGDLAGSTNASQTVAGIKGITVPTPTGSNTVLTYNLGAFSWGTSGGSITPGSPGQFYITNGSSATAWSTLDTFETAHGRITAGGGGSDTFAAVGPLVSFETSNAALWLLGHGATMTGLNPVVYSDGSSVNFNSPSAAGNVNFTYGGSTFAMSCAEATSNCFFGGSSTTSPLLLNWGTATSPIIQSGTNATALTLGTNKAGATLTLQADAAANVVQLAGGTQDSLALGSNLATSGHIRWPNAIALDGRNAGNTQNATLIHWDASNDLIIGDQSNVVAARLWGASSTGLQSGGGDYLIVDPGSYDFNGAITVTPSAGTASIVPTSGTMTIGGTATANSYVGAAQFTTRTVTASFTVDTTTTDNHICADTTSAAFTITLPAPTNGRRIELINCGFSGGSTGWALHNLTIARHGTENINGVSINKLLTGAGQPVCEIESPNGTNWFTNCQ